MDLGGNHRVVVCVQEVATAISERSTEPVGTLSGSPMGTEFYSLKSRSAHGRWGLIPFLERGQLDSVADRAAPNGSVTEKPAGS